MAEDEAHVDSTSIPLSEDLSEQGNTSIGTDTININSEIENMEVHKHPHHVTHKKKWGEYLLEFLMIFFAVTMGFFAEQIREGFVESRHEKEYMVSLVKDLESDTLQISSITKYRAAKIANLDSLLIYFSANTSS